MERCNLVYPYFNNPGMLQVQVQNWNEMSKEVRQSVRIILVDDHSDSPALPIFQQCTAAKSLLRFTTPGLWTMHEARNLGAFFAADRYPAGWLFLSDIDLVITPETLQKLLTLKLDRACHYTFGRVLAPDMAKYKYHPNSYLMPEEVFRTVNGYDVDFCGAYGGGYGGDGEFARQVSRLAPRIHLEEIELIGYGRSVIADASTTAWDRKEWKAKYRRMLDYKHSTGNLRSVNPVRRSWEQLI